VLFEFHIPSALRIASEACVVEILKDAGSAGMHVEEIAQKTGVDSIMLARSLRLLATHYVFIEVKPNVFSNNRISSIMDTNKGSEVVIAIAKEKISRPVDGTADNVQGQKYTDTSGVVALVEQCTDEVFKSSAYTPDVFLSKDYSKTPFQRALKFDGSMWEFFEKYPGYLQRIQMAMTGFSKLQPHQQAFTGFEWSELESGALVVDVGGGNGSEAFEISKKAPQVRIIVQDRAETIEQVTLPTWNSNEEQRSLLKSQKVELQGHDFFKQQPSEIISKAAVFHLRFITHDWPTAECITILKQLRASAGKHTKLLLVDQLVPYACPVPAKYINIKGASPISAPSPLLANLGQMNSDVYLTDFTMAALLNAQERTLGEFHDMLKDSGWDIEVIHQAVGSSLSQIVCKGT